ncbi:hypothetical protein DFJ58DRAFT_863121 [Suillus subalutaceus]|uniref:uncharacterized protein n=1 Tax=Suillus subalutaceus TaxID=48586 RepID=UPI001B8699A1|nr:uncharacterized protein DFJ58DRAFT_863121 [Suillus subalutaceus]KAG1837269.1 hypothetical protein DFJ58DRAFT_863121 [Suillus subalutaceus]
MKEKEPTSLKAISQASRPYPTTPCPLSQSSRSGPKYFPPDVLQEELDRAMDLIPYIPDPPSPPSPPSPRSPPDTPTPTGQTERVHPLQPDLLVYREFSVNSIHTPGNTAVDQMITDTTNPTASHAPTYEEQAILEHLVLANMNRSVLSQHGTINSTTLPQFTPAPTGGFPTVHMSHSAQIFDHLENRVLLAWFQVVHPKLMVRVFDHSGKEVAEQAAIIAERVRANITTIAESIHHDTPPIRVSPPQPQGGKGAKNFPIGFLVHKLLFGLTGFTTLDEATILQAVTDTWNQDETRYHIGKLFSSCRLLDDEFKATQDLISSCRVELLDFKITGGLSVPRFNILATSPTNDAKTWTNLRSYLSTLSYPTSLDGCGTTTALFACQICHSLAHPRALVLRSPTILYNPPTYSVSLSVTVLASQTAEEDHLVPLGGPPMTGLGLSEVDLPIKGNPNTNNNPQM